MNKVDRDNVQTSDPVSSQDFRNAYINLYDQLRNYLWDVDVLEKLAEVEVDIYDTFINMDKLRKDFKVLKSLLLYTELDDETNQCLKKLGDLVDGSDPNYFALKRVQEASENNSL